MEKRGYELNKDPARMLKGWSRQPGSFYIHGTVFSYCGTERK